MFPAHKMATCTLLNAMRHVSFERAQNTVLEVIFCGRETDCRKVWELNSRAATIK